MRNPCGRKFVLVLLLAVVICMVVPVCSWPYGTSTPSREVTGLATSTTVSSMPADSTNIAPETGSPTPAPSPTMDYWYATVNYVESGELVLLDNGLWVRYLGVQCPNEGSYGETQGKELNSSLVLNKRVKLEVDTANLYDSSHRLLAWVWVEDQIINYSIVRSGWARWMRTYSPASQQRWQWLMEKGEEEAQAERAGIWGPVQSAVIPGATIKYYDISGSTADQLYSQMDLLGPVCDDGSRAIAVTNWSVGWRWNTITNSYYGTCQLTGYYVDSEIEVTLPRWMPPANASPELIARWNDYFSSVVAHEKHHVDIALAGVTQIEQAMAQASCQTVSAAANQAATRAQAENERYDVETEHGTKDGVELF